MLGPVTSEFRRIVVDGANVVGSRPDGWWADRPGAARRLWERLRLLADGGADVILVLEGKARSGVPEGAGPPRVVHARGEGDAMILDVVRDQADPDQWAVVTADRDLAERVRALGAHVVGPTQLWRTLDR
jgi:hypothetical protein